MTLALSALCVTAAFGAVWLVLRLIGAALEWWDAITEDNHHG